MKSGLFLCILLLFLTPFLFAHQELKDLTIDSTGLSKLDIECGAGFLKIHTKKELSHIDVEAEISIKGISKDKASKYVKDEVILRLEKRGSTAYLVSKFKPLASLFSLRERSINLTVHIPSEIDLDVDDGSGSVWIENLQGKLKVHDGSGSMMIQNIGSDARITDGSGNMQIYEIAGNLEVDDGSGDLDIKGVRGNLDVDDGSGDFTAIDIQGYVDIDDGSGTIKIKAALGNVRVSDGSGSIIINGVEKDVIIKDDGSGSVDIKNVKGRVEK